MAGLGALCGGRLGSCGLLLSGDQSGSYGFLWLALAHSAVAASAPLGSLGWLPHCPPDLSAALSGDRVGSYGSYEWPNWMCLPHLVVTAWVPMGSYGWLPHGPLRLLAALSCGRLDPFGFLWVAVALSGGRLGSCGFL